MSNEFVRAMSAHPSQQSNFRKWEDELVDDFDVYADEAIALTESVPRLPRPAHPIYDTIIAALAGALFGVAAFVFLMVKDGAL